MDNQRELGKFIKTTKGEHECYLALSLAYLLSRNEVANIEWTDIDFDQDTIAIYSTSLTGEKKPEFKRTFPLLPHIKSLLLALRKEQHVNAKLHDYNPKFSNFIYTHKNGERRNKNALSRNAGYLAEEHGLKLTNLGELNKAMTEFLANQVQGDLYSYWTRSDINLRGFAMYEELADNPEVTEFLGVLDQFIKTGKVKTMEM